MRIAAMFLVVFGVLGLTTLPRSLPTAGNPRWPLLLFFSLLGILYIWLALGIWKRWWLAWQLGFVAIGLTALFFIVQACCDSAAANIKETPAFIGGCSV